MNIRSQNFDTRIPSLQGKVSPEEWEARVNLAACYRLVHLWRIIFRSACLASPSIS